MEEGHMTLEEVIVYLEKLDPSIPVPYGFDHPHSYRGAYYELAFCPKKDTTVGEMLECAREALGKTYGGYKGGEFTMRENTYCYLSEYGEPSSGQAIIETVLDLMCSHHDRWG